MDFVGKSVTSIGDRRAAIPAEQALNAR